MLQYIFISSVICFFFFLLFDSITCDFKAIGLDVWKRIILCFVLTLVYKCCLGFEFYGLEYEDAYVFDVAARQFSQGIYTSQFMTEIVESGSIEKPEFMGVYGGHFVTYPIFLSYFYKIFGNNIPMFHVATSILAFLMLLLLSIFPSTSKKWYVAPCIFCCAPIINVFGNTGLSEIFSSFVLLSFCYAFFSYIAKGNRYFMLTVCAFFLAILCKRENLIIFIIPCLYLLKGLVNKDKDTIRIFVSVCSVCALLILVYLFFIKNVFSIESEESLDLQKSTFSFAYWIRLFPIFISALFNLKYFSLIFSLFLVKIIYDCLTCKLSFQNITLVILFIGYLMLYTSHYRGYFFVHHNDVSQFDSFRYLNNFFFIVPLIFLNVTFERPQYFASIIMLMVISCVLTFYNRSIFSQKEIQVRFQDVEQVKCFIDSNYLDVNIITSQSLLYRSKMPYTQKIEDVRIWFKNPEVKGKDIFVLDADEDYLKQRYGISLPHKNMKEVYRTTSGTIVYHLK